MTKIILVRHGETEWNQQRRYQGQQDSPLSAKGIFQAQEVGKFLANRTIDAIYSSDLKRAFLTAQSIAKYHKLTPIADQRIRETSFGVWEGLTREEILLQYPDLFYARYQDSMSTRVPGGELPNEVALRLHEFLFEILPKHEKETIVLVSHGAALRLLIASLLEMPLEKSYCIRQDNAAVSEFYYAKDERQCIFEVVTINSTGHLS